MNKLVMTFTLFVCAAGAYAQPEAASPKRDQNLEAKYSAEYQKKMTEQTAKASDSLKTLYYGTAAVLIGVIGLGLIALVATKKQQRAIDMLVADME